MYANRVYIDDMRTIAAVRPRATAAEAQVDRYRLPMGKDATTGFGAYLDRAIKDAGYEKPTYFAREAGIDPSVVFRWISGEQRPTMASLEKVAPLLGMPSETLIRAAYPGTAEPPQPRRDEAEQMILDSDVLSAGQKKMMLERYHRRLEAGKREAAEDVREQIELLRQRDTG